MGTILGCLIAMAGSRTIWDELYELTALGRTASLRRLGAVIERKTGHLFEICRVRARRHATLRLAA